MASPINKSISLKNLKRYINEAKNHHLGKPTLLMIYNNLEIQEVISLKWKDIDFINKAIILSDRIYPLSKYTLEVLNNINRTSEFIFVNKKNQLIKENCIKNYLARVRKRLNINKLNFIILQRSFSEYIWEGNKKWSLPTN